MEGNPLTSTYVVDLIDPKDNTRSTITSYHLRFLKRDIYRAEIKLGYSLLGPDMITALQKGQVLVFTTAVLTAGLIHAIPDLTPDDVTDMLDCIVPESVAQVCVKAWLNEIYNPVAKVKGLPVLGSPEPAVPLASESTGSMNGPSPDSTLA